MTTSLPLVTERAARRSPGPVARTPARAPGSVRRTSSVDISRPDGPGGPLHVDGRARDAATHDPSAPPVHRRRAVPRRDPRPVPGARRPSTTDPAASLDALIGQRVAAGFRAKAAAAVPGAPRRRHPALPPPGRPARRRARLGLRAPAGRGDRTRAAGAVRTQRRPLLGLGVRRDRLRHDRGAPHGADDRRAGRARPRAGRRPARGWHELPDPVPGTVRRRRRIDVDRSGDDDRRRRDVPRLATSTTTAPSPSCTSTGWSPTIDPATLVVTAAAATPRVLPYVECPAAAASASRLVGLPPRRAARPCARRVGRHQHLHPPQRPPPLSRGRQGVGSGSTTVSFISWASDATTSPSRSRITPLEEAAAAGVHERGHVVVEPLVGAGRAVEPGGVVEAHHAGDVALEAGAAGRRSRSSRWRSRAARCAGAGRPGSARRDPEPHAVGRLVGAVGACRGRAEEGRDPRAGAAVGQRLRAPRGRARARPGRS